MKRSGGHAVVKRLPPTYLTCSDEIVCGLAPEVTLKTPIGQFDLLLATTDVHDRVALQNCKTQKQNLLDIAILVVLAAEKEKGSYTEEPFIVSVKAKGAETQAKTGAGRRAGFVAALRDLLI